MPEDSNNALPFTAQEIEEFTKKNSAELDAIMDGVGRVTTHWAMLETALYNVFSSLNGIGDTEPSGVIFYTPSNTETRISLVDNLMTYWFELRATNEHDATIFSCWDNIKGKINSLKNTRNAIAHGSISQFARGSALSQKPRLSPAFADTLRFMPQIKGGRQLGLGSAELETHRNAVGRAIERINRLNEVVRLQLLIRSGLDPAANQKLPAALSQLTTQMIDQNTQDRRQPTANDPDQSFQG